MMTLHVVQGGKSEPRRTVALVQLADHWRCALKVTRWGYPRALTDEDMNGFWFSYGDDVLFWFQCPDADGATTLHMCVAPESQRHVYARPVMERVWIAAEIFGLHRVYVISEQHEIVGYAERLGLQRDAVGYFKEIRHG